MKGIELYINRQLCDISNVKDFSIYLKRQFLNPAELSAKDAQRSYDITLPASPTNNAIFGYISTEEVKNKFATLYDAVLIMGGVKIFEGKFRLSEITSKQYTGNLGIPYTKTIKEIFGDKNMNEVGEWSLYFRSVEDITSHNQKTGKDDIGCFFPLVSYGLLPKVPLPDGSYSGKLLIDDTTRFGLEDFPPSLQCLQVVKKLFAAKNVELSGSAFSDERLTNLYMSYKNPSDYVMPWTYGDMASMYIKGAWSNGLMHNSVANRPSLFEMGGFVNSADSTEDAYTCNLLNSTNVSISKMNDYGHNISSYNTEFNYKMDNVGSTGSIKRKWNHYSINIPASGYYKVSLYGNLHIPSERSSNFRTHDKDNSKMTFVSAIDGGKYLDKVRYELKLVRDWGEGSFNVEETAIDGAFFENNFRQTYKTWKDKDNESSSFFPYINSSSYNNGNRLYKPCQMQFVDPAQNPNLVVGFSWGKWADRGDGSSRFNPMDKTIDYDKDPLKPAVWAQTLAAKSCYSWNPDSKDKHLSRVIVDSKNGYWKYSKTMNDDGTTSATPTFSETDNLKTLIDGSPANYARRAYYKQIYMYGKEDVLFNQYADGVMNAIVWFEKGEKLTLVGSSDRGSKLNWIWHQIDFELDIQPYRTDKGWAHINEYAGVVTNKLNWDDRPAKDYEFLRDKINLMKFLPSNVKIDDWLNNFCKAFNLELAQTGQDRFELNVKKGLNWNTSIIIDLDKRANVTVSRQNTPLGLPGTYELGFTADKDEIGYVNTTIKYKPDGSPVVDEQGKIKVHEGDDGGGRFETGSPDSNTVTQTSNFSHNWMINMEGKGNTYKDVSFPIIADKEVWNLGDNADYGEMMLKYYPDKPQRFWYRADGNYRIKINDKVNVDTALVTDTYKGLRTMVLNYKNTPDSILRNYFTVLTNADNCFTTVECYLSPEEYSDIEYSLARFNGDLYYIAEVDGYDPLGQKKATLKLIRKTL